MSITPQPLPAAERGAAIARVLAAYPALTDARELTWYAQALAQLGVHVVVLAPGVKKPFADYRTEAQRFEDTAAGRTRAGWQLGTTDPDRLASYIVTAVAQTGQLPNLGVHLAPSRLIVIDADNLGDCIHWLSRVGGNGGAPLELSVSTPGQIENGVWIHKDGAHVYYVLPDDVNTADLRDITEQNVPADQNRAGWGTKLAWGVGAALPPSVRPEGQYRWDGSTIPVAPDWLIDMLRKPPAPPKPVRTEEDDEFNESVDDAMDDVSWSDVFEGVALYDGEDRDGCGIWTRHGGTPRSMVAHDGCATAHGSVCVTVHSDTILTMYPLLDDLATKRGSRNFSKWEALAAFQFDGDLNAASREHGFSRPMSSVRAVAGSPFTVTVTHGTEPTWTPPPVASTATSYLDTYDGTTDPDWNATCAHGRVLQRCSPCVAIVGDRRVAALNAWAVTR